MFQGKVCVVNNGAKGIGRRVVEVFAEKGCNVAFMDEDGVSGRRLKRMLESQYGVDAFFFHGSSQSEEDLECFAASVLGQYEKVDFFINNASSAWKKVDTRDDMESLNQVLKLSMFAPFVINRVFEDNYGHGAAMVYVLPSRKAGADRSDTEHKLVQGSVESLMRIISEKHQGKVRVNCVDPDCIQNTQNKEKVNISQTIHFLCDAKSEFINGESLGADGGMMKLMAYHSEGGWSFNSQ